MKSLSKDDRRAVVALSAVILLCFLLFPFVDKITGVSEDDARKSEKLVGKGDFAKGKTRGNEYYAAPESETELFYFDPNTADSTQLLRLGLRPWQVRNIYKYRAAGGRYRKPEDFARLYGLTLKQYERLSPYIIIKEEVMAADVYGKSDAYQRSGKAFSRHDSARTGSYNPAEMGNSQRGTASLMSSVSSSEARKYGAYPKKIKHGERIDINVADTNALQTIPGIGAYFARQIVRQRQRIGGFHDVSQLLEIEGFPESSLSYTFVGSTSDLRKIKINQLDAWKLSRHPYILYVQAKEIVAYRQQKGLLSSPSQLESFKTFTPSDVKRLAPYLDFSR